MPELPGSVSRSATLTGIRLRTEQAALDGGQRAAAHGRGRGMMTMTSASMTRDSAPFRAACRLAEGAKPGRRTVDERKRLVGA
jgi:hypothetical protein